MGLSERENWEINSVYFLNTYMDILMFLVFIAGAFWVGYVMGFAKADLRSYFIAQQCKSIFSERDRIAKKIGDRILDNRGL